MNFIRSLATAVATSLIAFGAHAATVTYSSGVVLAPLELNQNLSLGLFNTSLGTLTNVTMRFDGASSNTIVLTNGSQTSQTTTGTVDSAFIWSSGLGALTGLLASANPLFALSATTGSQNIAANSSLSFGPLADADSVSWDAQLDGIFSAFQVAGPGNFTLTCQTLTGFTLRGGGGFGGGSSSSQAGCGAEVVYTYTDRVVDPNPVPEPASLALVALALGGLAFTRRKTRRS